MGHSLGQTGPDGVLKKEALRSSKHLRYIPRDRQASRQEDLLEFQVQDEAICYLNVTLSGMPSGV